MRRKLEEKERLEEKKKREEVTEKDGRNSPKASTINKKDSKKVNKSTTQHFASESETLIQKCLKSCYYTNERIDFVCVCV